MAKPPHRTDPLSKDDIATWHEQHRGRWVDRFPLGMSDRVDPDPLLGEEDASVEWAHREQSHPELLFAPTESSNRFAAPPRLFLFGRRGTGKTATLRMLEYSIRTKRVKDYAAAITIHPGFLTSSLVTTINGSTFGGILLERDLISFLRQCWMWVLRAAGLVALDRLGRLAPEESEAVRRCVGEEELRHLEEPKLLMELLTKQLAQLLKPLKSAPQADIAAAQQKVQDDLPYCFGLPASRALRSAALRSDGRAVLVLVDTDEVFPVHDKVSAAVNGALIEAVLDLYSLPDCGLLAKAAFPAELVPHMRPLNLEKTAGKSTYLLWSYRDLVTFLAKRYRLRLGLSSSIAPQQLEDFTESRRFLYQHLPEKLPTRNGLTFDCLAYIIRHTQKKPRQLLLLLNTVLTLAKQKRTDAFYDLRNSPGTIRDGIHARLDMLLSGTLDIYEEIYRDAGLLVRRVLMGARSHFPQRELDSLMKRARDVRQAGGLSRDDIRRLLFESGVVGLAKHVTNVREFDFVSALFQYQVKDSVGLAPDAICVIHPFCYEELQVKVDTTVFAFPMPYDPEEADPLTEAGAALPTIRPSGG